MMNIIEEAIIYATVLHQGKIRHLMNKPFILHPMEVAQITSTMTDDEEVICAGILHDIVDSTDGTLEEIEKRFGKRVASLVESTSETRYLKVDSPLSWKQRMEQTLRDLRSSDDIGTKIVWLADKLANIRALSGIYSEQGEVVWSYLVQDDPSLYLWYYQSIAEILELNFNRTGAFKEFIKHINFIWPGTFDSEKVRFKKYREASVEGCKLIGRGAKGEVYRYDEELVIKVFNENNLYHDVEREIELSRRAFILGIPTAISFGIVSVGERYGAMYELVSSETISELIARAPGQVDTYARIMAEVAHTIHSVEVSEDDVFPRVEGRLEEYINGGIGRIDEVLSKRCMKLLNALPRVNTLVHGDFHSNNVFMMNDEPLLIDMDRIARGHPISEISDLYYFYVVLGEDDPSVVEDFMGFSYETSKQFFRSFLESYLGTDDEARIKEVTDKASLLCYSRLIRKTLKKGEPSVEEKLVIARCLHKIADLTIRLETLSF